MSPGGRAPRPTARSSQADRFLAALLDALPVALFCKDASNGYRFSAWNRTSEEWFGLTREQVLGKDDYDFFPREQADFFRKMDEETMRCGQRVEIPEEPLDTPKGRLYLHTLKVPLRVTPDEPGYLLGISWDITEARERARELERQRAIQIAQARLASLGVMAGGVAHEINDPLSVIQGLASRLRRTARGGTADAEGVAAAASKIEQTVERIGKIVRGLRALSRMTEGDPKQRTSVGTIVEDVLSLCRSRFQAGGVGLEVGGDLAQEIECRPAEIGQVLLNLLSNAYDAVEARPQPWVRVDCEHRDGQVLLSVTDSGPGIEPSLAERIMEPFFTTKEVGRGTGLGLSLSRAIAEDHGGSLSLDAASPNTRVVLRLPSPAPVSP